MYMDNWPSNLANVRPFIKLCCHLAFLYLSRILIKYIHSTYMMTEKTSIDAIPSKNKVLCEYCTLVSIHC